VCDKRVHVRYSMVVYSMSTFSTSTCT